MAIPHFIYPFSSWRTFEFFLLLAIMNNAAMNSHVQVFVQTLSFLLGIEMRNFEELPDCFLKQVNHCTFPPVKCEDSGFSTSLSILFIISLFYYCTAILVVVKWYLIVVWICISLRIRTWIIFSYANCPLAHLLWRNVYSDPFSIFQNLFVCNLIKLWEFFIYSGYKSFIRYVI